MPLSLEEGTFLVMSARGAIESRLAGKKPLVLKSEPWLSEKCGLFVTLHTYPEKELRGCIGFTAPVYALKEGIAHAALSAAFEDTRFMPLSKPELQQIVVEVSVLSRPEKLDASSRAGILKEIRPKADGLILENGRSSGLFLPQVWDELPGKEEFLENLCYKAGLSNPDAWFESGARIYRFRVQAFEEEKPRGNVVERAQ